ncbi:hypothetical protein BLNAU_7377 [Blattamonas nauphoetae]|uniref:Uncharacterized protein n=1 Tax=Blattamonas nauphoetae TaxID=2049346 RepID=A0ABQ9Y1W2_9EUKA|nr:hypothetical protein BLNAU_7377 [Blattamonas nauphoetae]
METFFGRFRGTIHSTGGNRSGNAGSYTGSSANPLCEATPRPSPKPQQTVQYKGQPKPKMTLGTPVRSKTDKLENHEKGCPWNKSSKKGKCLRQIQEEGFLVGKMAKKAAKPTTKRERKYDDSSSSH